MKLTDWIIIDGYCATKVLVGTDPNKVENRVAFIEKTPRIKIGEEWVQGDKGSGGAYTYNHEELGQYGFDLDSRKWCDEELLKLGYEL
jgi:hypothetical protein